MLDLVSLVIPVKPGPGAKSRLASQNDTDRAELAAAIALDTVEAARASARVGEVLVVGALPQALPGVRVIGDPAGGLTAAIDAGLAALLRGSPTAVLLGDLPALRPEDLTAALTLAAGHERAFVADTEGTGTTLIVARALTAHDPRFGTHSAELHRVAGYVELALPALSGLRRDVDTLDQLEAAASSGLGPRTRALLTRLRAPRRP